MRKHSIARTVGLIAAVILALSVVGYLYISNYYHADKDALSCLAAIQTAGQNNSLEEDVTSAAAETASDTVTVSEIEHGLLLDGPGTENAMIFYPGGKVEYISYLPLLNRLAKGGLDCFLTEMPANLAILDWNRADDIIAAYSYDHWYLAGHSLGGVVAAMYASGADEPPEGLFLLAAYPIKQLPEMTVLELYGSEDLVLDRKKLEKTEKYLPGEAVVWEIPGGNHAQFGNYGPQEGDGQASIPAEVQQEITKEMILKQLK